MATFIPCILALLLAVNAATALRCYECNSKDSTACSWGIASFTYDSKECGTGGVLDKLISPKCYKMTAESKSGGEYIARGCLTTSFVGCESLASGIGWISSHSSNDPDSLKNLQCDTCDSDNCNSAQKLTGVTLLGIVLAAAIFAF